MAWVLLKLKQPQEALPYALKAAKLSEEPDATVYDHLGDIYAALKETEQGARGLAQIACAGAQRGSAQEARARRRRVNRNVLPQNSAYLCQSGRGQPHSKTLRDLERWGRRVSVLECGCPLPLSSLRELYW